MLRQPCDLAATTYSKRVCTASNAACQGCTQQQESDGKPVPAPRCGYVNPPGGHHGGNLGGTGVTPVIGGLTTCMPMFAGAGGCTAAAATASSPTVAAISCASVVAGSIGNSLSGGQGILCCADKSREGWVPGCAAGAAVRQLNLDIKQTKLASSSCMPGCNAGYTLTPGKNITSCSNGVLTLAECTPNSCPPVDVARPPFNGDIGTCSGNLAHGSTCIPKCSPPFRLVNGPSRCTAGVCINASCMAKRDANCGTCCVGVFHSAQCKLSCGVPALPANASSRGSCVGELGPNRQCQPTCKAGYVLTPATGYTCSATAILTPAKCQAPSCDLTLVAAPPHGGPGDCCVGGCQLAHGSSCRPVCHAGYSLLGRTTCSFGRVQAAPCRPMGCPFVAPTNGGLSDCSALLPHGGRCTPTCNAGFYLGMDDDACSVGLAGRLGSNVQEKCEALVGCSYIAAHGSCTNRSSILEVSCSAGQLTGAIQCEEMPCTMVAPAHGSIGDCPPRLASGSSCRPRCLLNYRASGLTHCYAGKLHATTCRPPLQSVCDSKNRAAMALKSAEHEDQCNRSMAAASAITIAAMSLLGGAIFYKVCLHQNRLEQQLGATSPRSPGKTSARHSSHDTKVSFENVDNPLGPVSVTPPRASPRPGMAMSHTAAGGGAELPSNGTKKTVPMVDRTPAERDAAEESELRQLWARVDLDSSGLLDHREVRKLMSDMGKQLSDDQFTRAMADIDSDGSGEVDFTEFLQWWQMQDPEAQNQLRLLHQVRVCDYACAQSSSQMTSML
jgi:hypothetical protein